tara:strand:- start:982 stop:1095 length:114 start_codon:yes stop_codon:yes gene_type:complete
MPDKEKKTNDNDVVKYIKSLIDKVKKQFETDKTKKDK